MIRRFGKIFGAVMNCIYWFFKHSKTENKIAFISRQSERPSLDFRYLTNEIRTNYPQYKVEVYCKMIPSSFSGKVKYLGEMFKQMKAMATSRVIVLDGYCILASMLKHKPELKIIQIWHALGSFKKFGKSILDKEGGKSSEVAEAFKMHQNYDLIAASGDKCVKNFAEAFGQDESKFIPIGMPRMDYLTDKEQDKRLKDVIYNKYPELNNGRKNILYVPTFRDTPADKAALEIACDELISAVNYNEYNLIVNHHVVDTNMEEIYTDSRTNSRRGESFIGMELMAVADCVVTDYSSIVYEALLKNIPVYIYCFDSEKYIDDRGFYIDFWRDIPAVYSKNAKGIFKLISDDKRADEKKIQEFKHDYVNMRFDSVTKIYGIIIDELIKGTYDNRFNFGNLKDETEGNYEDSENKEENGD